MDPAVEVAVLAMGVALAIAPVVVGMVVWQPEPREVTLIAPREPPQLVACEVVEEIVPEPVEEITAPVELADPDIEDFARALWDLGITEIESIASLTAMYDEYRVDVGAKPLSERGLARRVSKTRGIKRYRDTKSAGNPTRYRVTQAAAAVMRLVA